MSHVLSLWLDGTLRGCLFTMRWNLMQSKHQEVSAEAVQDALDWSTSLL